MKMVGNYTDGIMVSFFERESACAKHETFTCLRDVASKGIDDFKQQALLANRDCLGVELISICFRECRSHEGYNETYCIGSCNGFNSCIKSECSEDLSCYGDCVYAYDKCMEMCEPVEDKLDLPKI